MLSVSLSDTVNPPGRATPSPDRALLGPRVLIVDDDPVSQLLAGSKVKVVCGSEAAIVCNGAQALDAVRQTEYDLILMDIDMPVLGGLATTLRIRQLERQLGRRSPASIIAHTSPTNARCLAEPQRLGFDDVLEKPSTLEQMAACFRAWCRGHRAAVGPGPLAEAHRS